MANKFATPELQAFDTKMNAWLFQSENWEVLITWKPLKWTPETSEEKTLFMNWILVRKFTVTPDGDGFLISIGFDSLFDDKLWD